ncbi:MAG: hypothetical protein HRK26_00405 [Rickettsiaceae bacterium H1]|nr:hypothetical protein [Rickettsiaceae bacterium H1]
MHNNIVKTIDDTLVESLLNPLKISSYSEVKSLISLRKNGREDKFGDIFPYEYHVKLDRVIPKLDIIPSIKLLRENNVKIKKLDLANTNCQDDTLQGIAKLYGEITDGNLEKIFREYLDVVGDLISAEDKKKLEELAFNTWKGFAQKIIIFCGQIDKDNIKDIILYGLNKCEIQDKNLTEELLPEHSLETYKRYLSIRELNLTRNVINDYLGLPLKDWIVLKLFHLFCSH